MILDDGELGGKRYFLLPRSKTGPKTYRWIDPLSDGPLPCIDPWEAELAFDGTEPTETTETTDAMARRGRNKLWFLITN